MEIKRFNESLTKIKFNKTSSIDIDDLQDMLVNKFFGEDVGNMASYDPYYDAEELKMDFNFVIIENEEFNIIQELRKFLEKYSLYLFVFRPYYVKKKIWVMGMVHQKM